MVTCTDLLKRDAVSNRDPVCVLWVKKKGEWEEFKRTKDSHNHHGATEFVLDYRFEERQLLKFEVIDIEENKFDRLGHVECSLGELVAKQSTGFSGMLVNEDKSPAGKIFVQAREVVKEGEKETVELVFEGQKLDDKDVFPLKSDPFMEISRVNENGGFSKVYRTETVDNNLNPLWKPISIEVSRLCSSDYNQQLKFDVFDEDFGGKDDFIGSFFTTVRTLIAGPGPLNTYQVINKKEKQKPKYTDSGKVILKSINRTRQTTFLDFLSRGLQLNFTVAVDFTASNGLPNNPISLHYNSKDEKEWNDYETAIRSIGEVIQDYDADKLYEALGFGAIVPPSNEVSPLFNLRQVQEAKMGPEDDQNLKAMANPGNSPDPDAKKDLDAKREQEGLEEGKPDPDAEKDLDVDHDPCNGVEGIIDAYKKTLSSVKLHGPTNFAPVIKHMARQAAKFNSKPTNYSILLIITDGIVTDMEDTKTAIIKASGLPLSIIIVGIGDEDFSQMKQLDSDNTLLKMGTNEAKRDIVQFIAMKTGEEDGKKVVRNKEELAKEVLKEVPKQVTDWMYMRQFATVVNV